MKVHTSRLAVVLSVSSFLLGGCGAAGCGGTQARAEGTPAVAQGAPSGARGAAAPAAPMANAHAGDPAAMPGEDPPGGPEGITQQAGPVPAGLAVATFAGGCFWCIEYAFEHVNGVRDAISGYTGGPEQHPSYEAVSNHQTGQAEAVRVLYDPNVVTYEQLLDVFWRRIDPRSNERSFSDWGRQYRSVIFAHTPAQRAAAERSVRELDASHRFEAPVATTIEDAGVFWVAEDYHQNFWRTHPRRFAEYHENSGRREFLRAHWGANAEY